MRLKGSGTSVQGQKRLKRVSPSETVSHTAVLGGRQRHFQRISPVPELFRNFEQFKTLGMACRLMTCKITHSKTYIVSYVDVSQGELLLTHIIL